MEIQIYIICLGVGLLFTLASALMGHFLGGGHEGHVEGSGGHAEAGLGGHGMPSISAFSPLILASFVTAFGGLGIIFHEIPATNSPWKSAPLAAVGAFAIAYVLLFLLRLLFKDTQASSEGITAEAVGVVGHVITPIPENGVGEIAYVQAGSRYTAPAREEKGLPVSNGQTVKITRIVGSQFYVAPA
jgi:membrane protein implicated in regulation of membrane protease activity